MRLRDLHIGQSATITQVGGEGALRQHFLDMGVIPGARVTLEKYAPMGDPMELNIQGYQLTLRLNDASEIQVEPLTALQPETDIHVTDYETGTRIEHPGFGEDGPRYHSEVAQPLHNRLSFALVGNQNCGKTTLFNQLTGSNQHVGNFPGVTVDRKDGTIKGHPKATVTDLPGIYSLSPYTNEEVVSRRFILEEHPSAIINIVDATNIERNLYLTMQLMELDTPMVLALNMMDEVENNGGTIRINEMERMLGIPVIPISAMKNEGVHELVEHALHIAQYQERPSRQDFCDATEHGGAVHRCLHSIMHFIEDHAQKAGLPLRFAASKLIENDSLVLQSLGLTQNERETIEHILQQMEEERGLDRCAAIADMRFGYIHKVCRKTVVKPRESKERMRSRRIDRILTGKWTALPAFIGIMGLVFYLTFESVGLWMQDLCETALSLFTVQVENLLAKGEIAPIVRSLITDGIINGVGTVVVFLPLIICLFFFLSLLEDSGYMARVAFVMDKGLRRLGLSGRSIVPLLIGFGCSVPSVMASRTLPSERDRKLTILLTPFMSCTAKIPIYAFFSAAFFPEHTFWAMVGLYLLGIATGIATALVFKHTLFRGEAVPFVMELPNYRLPVMKNVAQLLWEKARDFLQRAFTVIFLASIFIWFLQSFDFFLHPITPENGQDSILAQIASLVSPLFTPLGLDDWRIVTALASGFLAKEVVVSTLSTLFAGTAISTVFSAGTAVCIMVFSLLYTPCVAAIATIRRELGGRWAFFVVVMQCAIAWFITFLVHLAL